MSGMFHRLEEITARPAPFQFYTARKLWTDPHIARQMLSFHLNGDIEAASRSGEFMDRSAWWIAETFSLGGGKRVLDLGCGPGLMASRLARLGAVATGVDFSPGSIEWARKAAEKEHLPVRYICADYLEEELAGGFDLIIMIMCDFCALSPVQRKALVRKFNNLLNPGGAVLLDVYSMAAFHEAAEKTEFGRNLMDGFWAPGDYWGFHSSFKYPDEKVTLDKYSIFAQGEDFVVYNWLQHFTPESLAAEFTGFSSRRIVGDVAGGVYSSENGEFAIIAARE